MAGIIAPWSPSVNTPATSPTRPTRLLLVDDEVAHLEALVEVLGAEGLDVLGAGGPQQALEMLATQGFDLLLCDLKMPGMDGIELVRRARERDPDLVAVLMTGHGSIETAVEAMKAGALDYVLKPLRMSALRPVLARALEVRRLREHNRALEAQVQAYTARLEVANRELDAFAGRVAHDLQGPVHVMLGFARIVQERAQGRLDEETLRYLDRIVVSGQRMEGLIRDLLRFARLGSGPLQKASVDLGEVLEQARQTVLEGQAPRAVQWDIAPLPRVAGDPGLLRQVFINLLSNALKFTRSREPACISVGCREHGDEVELWVRDNGVGFEPAATDRLFKAFERLHRADEFEGHGVGLAACKRIIERHDGQIRADARPGEGATFTLMLPRTGQATPRTVAASSR